MSDDETPEMEDLPGHPERLKGEEKVPEHLKRLFARPNDPEGKRVHFETVTDDDIKLDEIRRGIEADEE